ncbi:MAG: glycosyltransferase family 2 protein, partial [Deltaproteobacteria bacterium]|nr:glycosyltransferase family 2 protein [Deltaproteobacteria bacterium]
MTLDISFVIVNWNTKELLLECVASIFQTVEDLAFEVWVVDNASTDGSVQAVKDLYPEVNVIENAENLGFAAANNIAFKRVKGRYILLLNTDTKLKESAAGHLYEFMESNPVAGLACGQLLNPDGSKQNSIANFPSLLSLLSNETLLRVLMPGKFPSKRKRYENPIEVDSCIGACLIVRKKALDQVGPFDERYFFFFEETDLAYRMKRAGWKIYFVPCAEIYHAQGKTVGQGLDSRMRFYTSRYAYFRKWFPRSYPLFFAAVFFR